MSSTFGGSAKRLRYWWVNQNQTHRAETRGGYLWSPKRKSNGQHNPFYEFMREVAPGDLLFSFVDTRIVAIGIASSFCYECPKPTEFGGVGEYWDAIGWKVDVSFRSLANRVRPKDHIAQLRSSLPGRYAPIRANGDGLQSIYLTEVPEALANVLFTLIGAESHEVRETANHLEVRRDVGPGMTTGLEQWESVVESGIRRDALIADTERTALIQARRGQGLFRSNVFRIERACRVTKVDRPEHLIASHTKPWRDSDNEERLNGENGLVFTVFRETPIGHHGDDCLDNFFTQASSQWDGLTHVGDFEHGFWGGVKNEELRESHDKSRLGIDHWARRGIAGRAVVLDVARWRAAQGRPIDCDTSEPITVADLEGTRRAQKVEFRPGDVWIIHLGWVEWYERLPPQKRQQMTNTALRGVRCGVF